MNDQIHVYRGTEEGLQTTDVDGPLARKTEDEEIAVASAYASAAEDREKDGRFDEALVYRLLHDLFMLNPTFDTPESPFGPMFVVDNRRSLIPDAVTA